MLNNPGVESPADDLIVDIQPTHGWASLKLKDLWQYRELLYFLTWRNVKVRYKQTLIGVLWIVLQPLLTVLIFSVIFGLVLKVPSDDVPYPLFYFTAFLPWNFFATGLTQASSSLVSNANLIKKVYFPRMVIPISFLVAGIVDFLIAFAVFIGMMAVYCVPLTANVLWLPLLLLLAFVTSIGVGLWLSAMNALYRDVTYAVPFLIQIWFYATPIIYPSKMLGPTISTLLAINPMSGVIEGFRWALLGTDTAPGPMIAVSAVVAIFLFISGMFHFRRVERIVADVV